MAAACLAGAVFLVPQTARAVQLLTGVAPAPMPVDQLVCNLLIYFAAAVLVLVSLTLATDRDTVGLQPPWADRTRAAMAYYMRAVCPAALVGFLLLDVVAVSEVRGWTGGTPLPPVQAMPALDLLRAAAAGLVEQSIATALVLIVLERTGARRHRRGVADTAWAPVIVVVVHLSYQLHLGTRAAALIVPVVLTVWCWRRTRNLTGLILGHAVYDALLAAVAVTLPGMVALPVLILLFVVLGSWLDTRPSSGGAERGTGRTLS